MSALSKTISVPSVVMLEQFTINKSLQLIFLDFTVERSLADTE